MVQKVVELTEEQAENLENLARLRDISVEELLADAVNSLLRMKITWAHPTDEQRRRAAALAGSFSSGLTDLAENHDRYLAEDYAK